MNCAETTRHIVYELNEPNGPGYRLELRFSHSSVGTTLDFYTVWPGARSGSANLNSVISGNSGHNA